MTTSDTNQPRRPLRKGRLILLILLALVLLLVLGHHLWTNHQRSRLMAAIQQYREAGEPVLPEDFAPPATEDPDNPVREWRAAAAALKPLDPKLQHRADWRSLSVPLTEAEDNFLVQLLDGQQEALSHAETASRMSGRPDWSVHFVSPTLEAMLPNLGPERALANMLKWAALHAHYHADDALAVDRLLQIMALGRAMQHRPALVGHLVAIGIEALACDTACTIGPELRVGSPTGVSTRPARPQQVRKLIAELLDDHPLREGQILAFRTERMMELDMAMQMASGNVTPVTPPSNRNANGSTGKQGVIGALLSPQFYGDARFMLDYTSGVLKAAQAPDFPTSRTRMSALPDVSRKRGLSHLMISILVPAFDRAIEQDFRILTDSRLTALSLACRMYAIDHGGDFPTMLDDLVPDYLPSIPADPFATGSPLRYRSGSNAVVYSVGENGIDDGGSEQPINERRQDDRFGELDIVTHLTLQRRAAPPEDTEDAADTATTEPTTAPATGPTIR
jgi:hypothetical protein